MASGVELAAMGCRCMPAIPSGSEPHMWMVPRRIRSMVIGPGGRRFGDTWRLGLPLLVLVPACGDLPCPGIPRLCARPAMEGWVRTLQPDGAPHLLARHAPSPPGVGG